MSRKVSHIKNNPIYTLRLIDNHIILIVLNFLWISCTKTIGLAILEAEYEKYADPALGTGYAKNQVFCVLEYSVNMRTQYR